MWMQIQEESWTYLLSPKLMSRGWWAFGTCQGRGKDEGFGGAAAYLWGLSTSGPALGLACHLHPSAANGRVQALGGCLLGMRSPRRAAFLLRLGSGATLWPCFAQGLRRTPLAGLPQRSPGFYMHPQWPPGSSGLRDRRGGCSMEDKGR